MSTSYDGMSGILSPFGGGGLGQSRDVFPSPWLDVASAAMPDTNRNALQWCLPPGALVELSHGQLKPIEDVKEGERVLTRGGSYERILRTSSREYSGELVQLTYAGFGIQMPFCMTPEHQVWRISTPRLSPGRLELDPGLAERVPAREVTPGDFVATPVVPGDGDVSPRFDGYLLGAYIAEGHPVGSSAGVSGVVFTLGADDEKLGYVARIQACLLRGCDLDVVCCTPSTRPDIRLLRAYDVELTDWCIVNGGRRSTMKCLGPEVFNWSRNQILRLIAAWIDGDGWTNENSLYGCTSSKILALQLIRLANKVGLSPTMCRRPPRNEAGDLVITRSDNYQIRFDHYDSLELRNHSLKGQSRPVQEPKQGKDKRQFVKDGYVFRKITGADVVEYAGKVYNFEVENDHSYIADGVLTSNCEFIFQQNGMYRMAVERTISYFLTDVELGSADPRKQLGEDEKERWDSFLHDTIGIKEVIQCLDRDCACYGNSFATLMVPFKRFLSCPQCHNRWTLREIAESPDFNFNWTDYSFVASCPHCKVGRGYRGAWTPIDEFDDLEKVMRVKLWSPHEIEILTDPWTGQCTYFWKIPEDYKRSLRRGELFSLERAPKEVLKAVKNNWVYHFAPETLFHMREPTLGGVKTRGWGLSRTLVNFRDIFYVQVLRRYNEAIALDYIIPFRVLTPDVRQAGGGMGGAEISDPMRIMDQGDFSSQVRNMLRKRRRDPASWNVLPFPLKYQSLGGEASDLMPTELIEQGDEAVLNAVGTPMELYRGTLQLQTAPVSLRLFEATHHSLVYDNNRFLTWFVNASNQVISLPIVQARMRRVTHADDFNKQMAALQLMMGQSISQTTGLRGMGVDYKDEQRLIAEEARYQQLLQAEIQEEMQQSAFGEQIAQGQAAPGAPAGGAPGDPMAAGGAGGGAVDPATGQPSPGPVTGMITGSSVPVTPEEMVAQAEALAQSLLGLPETQRLSEMRMLKQKSAPLHALTMQKVKEIRQQARSAGQSMMLGQTPAAGG